MIDKDEHGKDFFKLMDKYDITPFLALKKTKDGNLSKHAIIASFIINCIDFYKAFNKKTHDVNVYMYFQKFNEYLIDEYFNKFTSDDLTKFFLYLDNNTRTLSFPRLTEQNQIKIIESSCSIELIFLLDDLDNSKKKKNTLQEN